MRNQFAIQVLEVQDLPYPEKLCAAVLQGIVNRESARIFLDYGIYDDPDARRTNEVFIDDTLWFGKYRQMVGYQDRRNLEYYRTIFNLNITKFSTLPELIHKHCQLIKGLVVWDDNLPDTANIAVMLCAQEALLPITVGMLEQLSSLNLPIRHDLRKRWADRVSLYSWAFENLFPKCAPGKIACSEPGWQHPEFIDFIVQQKIFLYSLSSQVKGLGSTLLLLLSFGPAWLRELLFFLRLDGLVRKFALTWMGWKSAEVRLSNRIQRSVTAKPFPTIFGWHTRRDDELAFMLQLSANGLRLVPSHLAGNFSFHRCLPVKGISLPAHELSSILDPEGIYLTFTLSDGDQLMMSSTGQLGNWYSPSRGEVPFNWEVQPLLLEFAPVMLERFLGGVTENDCLIAGPSGAGYLIPSLSPALPAYMRDTTRLCRQAGITVTNPYIADLPLVTIKTLMKHKGELLGFLSGYAVIDRAPLVMDGDTPYAANCLPLVSQIGYPAEQLLEEVRREIARDIPRPRFIGVHLFAYRTSLEDVHRFAKTIIDNHVHIVRADDFLNLARESLRRNPNGKYNQSR